jgi:hypothetical protein
MEAYSNFTPMPYVIHKALHISQPVSKTHKHAILERNHAVFMNMLRTAEIDISDSVKTSDIGIFLSAAACYHTVLKASPSAAIFRRDMLLADWKKIGEHRQQVQ